MGCDIHIVVEQSHPDGSWEAVMHDMEGVAGISRPGTPFIEAFGRRSYPFLGLLRGVRQNEDGPWLATDGLPGDANDFARDRLDPEMVTDLHSQGWITYNDLLDALLDETVLPQTLIDPELHAILASRVRLLEEALKGADPVMIFRGRYCDEDTEIYHPDMANLSAHERLVIAKRCGELSPVTGHSIRVLFAFDN